MKAGLCLAALVALLMPGLAQACRGIHSHRYVVLRDPPARLPQGSALIKVELIDGLPGRDSVGERKARLLTGRDAGSFIFLRPDYWSDCHRWQEESPTGYVVVYSGAASGPDRLNAVTYRSRQYRTPDEEYSVGKLLPIEMHK